MVSHVMGCASNHLHSLDSVSHVALILMLSWVKGIHSVPLLLVIASLGEQLVVPMGLENI